jgi:hypothetical protein
VPARPQSSRRRGSVLSAVAYVTLGFVLGAIFWHFVGFWDFVGQVMFGSRTTTAEVGYSPPPIKLKDRVSGSSSLAIVPEPSACTALQLDRATGTTTRVDCELQPLPLRSGLKVAKREDRWVSAEQRQQAATSRGWGSVKVAPGGLQASAD